MVNKSSQVYSTSLLTLTYDPHLFSSFTVGIKAITDSQITVHIIIQSEKLMISEEQ